MIIKILAFIIALIWFIGWFICEIVKSLIHGVFFVLKFLLATILLVASSAVLIAISIAYVLYPIGLWFLCSWMILYKLRPPIPIPVSFVLLMILAILVSDISSMNFEVIREYYREEREIRKNGKDDNNDINS